MRRVLIVGPHFPPSSLPSAQRLRFIASHLRAFGWQPTVLAVDPAHYENTIDDDLERLVPASVAVVRTGAWSARWTRRFGVGDIGMRSLWHHWRALSTLLQAEPFDLLFVSVPPYVPMVLARVARERFGLPYVIDYQDPWITDYYWKLPRAERPPKWAAAYAIARALEPTAVRRASAIVGVSRGTVEDVLARYTESSAIVCGDIPLGAEPNDFEFVRAHPRPNRIFDPGDDKLHVSYVGVCIPQMRDVLRTMFDAVRLGLERSSELFDRVRLHFVGTSYTTRSQPFSVSRLAGQCGVGPLVTERIERVPYLESLQVLLDSHALLLPGTEEPHYTASKVFPYVLSRRPLLTLFHEASSVVDILRRVHGSAVVTFSEANPPQSSVEEVHVALERILRLPRERQADVNCTEFEQFTTRAMAGRLAAVFDRVVSAGAFAHVAVASSTDAHVASRSSAP
jgi:hypothetical protein